MVVITSVGEPLRGKESNVEIVELMSGMEDRGWQARANCMGVDPDLFFPERGASTREAKEVCRGCVAREDCLEYALDNGEPFFAWPPVRETLEKTMAEVLRCTKADITINTFALDIERSQFPFVEQIAKVNGGRLFYTDVDDLGSYALDDFVKHRRAG